MFALLSLCALAADPPEPLVHPSHLRYTLADGAITGGATGYAVATVLVEPSEYLSPGGQRGDDLGWDGFRIEALKAEYANGDPTRLRILGTLSDGFLYPSLATSAVYFLSDWAAGGLRHGDQRGLAAQRAGRAAGVILEAQMVTWMVTDLAKRSADRPRPYVYACNESGGDALSCYQWFEGAAEPKEADPDRTFSFFSGHTSMVASATFAAAQVWLIDHPDQPAGVYVATYGAAALLTSGVATLRVSIGKHFPSDVVTGALVGAGLGIALPELHRLPIQPTVATTRDGGVVVGVTGRL